MEGVPKKTLRAWDRKLATMERKLYAMQAEAMEVFGRTYEANITDDFDNIEIALADARVALGFRESSPLTPLNP